jgi:AhpD family alkylhydroperoxidase
VELTAAIAWKNHRSRFNDALGMGYGIDAPSGSLGGSSAAMACHVSGSSFVFLHRPVDRRGVVTDRTTYPQAAASTIRGGIMKQRMVISKLAPEAYKAVAELDKRVSESGIDGALYLLAKIRASQIYGCAFCIDLHTREARNRGETEERIYALNAWRESPLFAERERAAPGLTEAVTIVSETRVPDDVWDETEGAFDKRELANVLMATVAINAWNRIAVATRLMPRHATGDRTNPATVIRRLGSTKGQIP